MDGERESGKASHSYTPSLPYILVSAVCFFSSGPDHFQEMVSFFFPFFFFLRFSFLFLLLLFAFLVVAKPAASLIDSVCRWGLLWRQAHAHIYTYIYTLAAAAASWPIYLFSKVSSATKMKRLWGRPTTITTLYSILISMSITATPRARAI